MLCTPACQHTAPYRLVLLMLPQKFMHCRRLLCCYWCWGGRSCLGLLLLSRGRRARSLGLLLGGLLGGGRGFLPRLLLLLLLRRLLFCITIAGTLLRWDQGASMVCAVQAPPKIMCCGWIHARARTSCSRTSCSFAMKSAFTFKPRISALRAFNSSFNLATVRAFSQSSFSSLNPIVQ